MDWGNAFLAGSIVVVVIGVLIVLATAGLYGEDEEGPCYGKDHLDLVNPDRTEIAPGCYHVKSRVPRKD